jgi:hypothetical protein
MENAMRVLEEQGWIYGQVNKAANNIGNFSQASA